MILFVLGMLTGIILFSVSLIVMALMESKRE